jgi:uncharacterized protein YjbI with pentapeptide repeats
MNTITTIYPLKKRSLRRSEPRDSAAPVASGAPLRAQLFKGRITDAAQLRQLTRTGWDLSAADGTGLRLQSAADALYAVNVGANLAGADLSGVNLNRADLRGAILSVANLGDASLRGANLEGAELRGTNLLGADLSGAGLRGANLHGANLERTNLVGADRWDQKRQGEDLRQAMRSPGCSERLDGAWLSVQGSFALPSILSGQDLSRSRWVGPDDEQAIERFLQPLLRALAGELERSPPVEELLSLGFDHWNHNDHSILTSIDSISDESLGLKVAMMQAVYAALATRSDTELAPVAGPVLAVLIRNPRYGDRAPRLRDRLLSSLAAAIDEEGERLRSCSRTDSR